MLVVQIIRTLYCFYRNKASICSRLIIMIKHKNSFGYFQWKVTFCLMISMLDSFPEMARHNTQIFERSINKLERYSGSNY